MKTLISYTLALVLVAALPSMALAKGNKADKPFGGKVTAVDTTANTITLTKHKTGEARTFKTAGATITVDGVSGTLETITVGMHAKVTVGASPDTASSIVARTHKRGGKNNKSGT